MTYLGYQDTEFRNLVRNIVLFRAQPHQSSRTNQPGPTLKTTSETVPLVADLSVLIRNPCWLFDKFGQWDCLLRTGEVTYLFVTVLPLIVTLLTTLPVVIEPCFSQA